MKHLKDSNLNDNDVCNLKSKQDTIRCLDKLKNEMADLSESNSEGNFSRKEAMEYYNLYERRIENIAASIKSDFNNIVTQHELRENERIVQLRTDLEKERQERLDQYMEIKISYVSLQSKIDTLISELSEMKMESRSRKNNLLYPIVAAVVATLVNAVFMLIK